MYEIEQKLVQVTDAIRAAGLRPLTRGNAEDLARLDDELTNLLEQAADVSTAQ
ncbi:hypothetical protein [Ruegeria sp. Ofav3-42]|uniref:hypothetical protein n=1 Tax=Ruegeria sp. Ofav3-42 TaxID=2917759 RepID=UPI001EF5216A|nr:hypothetical protein [Ruegeria sp. Ofav3-42]MCG7518445.1 hypothetical protein [Ruegeria sp. Ofav3-42]